jgi:hypothetical protein
VVKDGLLVTFVKLRGTSKLINGFGMAVIGPEFFKEGELLALDVFLVVSK